MLYPSVIVDNYGKALDFYLADAQPEVIPQSINKLKSRFQVCFDVLSTKPSLGSEERMSSVIQRCPIVFFNITANNHARNKIPSPI